MATHSKKHVEKLAQLYIEKKALLESAEADMKKVKEELIEVAGIGAEIEVETDLGIRNVKIDEQTQVRLDTAALKIAMPEICEKFSKEISFTVVRIVKQK